MAEIVKLLYESNEKQDLLLGDTHVIHVSDPSINVVAECQAICGSNDFRCHVDPVRESDSYAAFCDCKSTHKYNFLKIMVRVFLVLGILLGIISVLSDLRK